MASLKPYFCATIAGFYSLMQPEGLSIAEKLPETAQIRYPWETSLDLATQEFPDEHNL